MLMKKEFAVGQQVFAIREIEDYDFHEFAGTEYYKATIINITDKIITVRDEYGNTDNVPYHYIFETEQEAINAVC